MPTPPMDQLTILDAPMIGLWRTGRRDGKGGHLDRLYDFASLGFPDRICRIVVGSGRSAHIRVTDAWTSSQHFALTAEDGGIYVEDLNSSHGTRINSVPLRQPEILRVGMTILSGTTELVAVDATVLLPAGGRSYDSYLSDAERVYGSARAASKKIGRSHSTIRRAALSRFARRMFARRLHGNARSPLLSPRDAVLTRDAKPRALRSALASSPSPAVE